MPTKLKPDANWLQIEDMLNEVKFSTYVDNGEYKTHVDMDDFIRRTYAALLFVVLLVYMDVRLHARQ